MGSFTVSSIFTCGYRRLGIPLTPCRALASAAGYSLSKHNHINELGLCALVPSRRNFGCKSLKLDAEYTNAAPVNGYPAYNRLLPCPSHSSAPRVEHLLVSEEGLVIDFICRALDLPPL
uniref:RNA pseudouridine synthase 6ic n=1 Tax=Rhizophora mucronata TaxID=61149 RepID=A0A2P2KV95_RHIMU